MNPRSEVYSSTEGSTLTRHRVLLWLATGALGAILCMYEVSGALVHGEFIPADQDSFYHARRILDAIPAPLEMYQFDPRIHSPEGSWITWPWAYDMSMAAIGHFYVSLTGSPQPLSLLAFVAPAWFLVNALLMLGITIRLRLSFPLQTVAMVFHALLPLNRGLHRVGMLDHHFIEYSFVLGTLYVGLGFFSALSYRGRAIALGTLLGMAPAFHNGLFILQLPILLTTAILWYRHQRVPPRSAYALAASLLLVTALFLLPSAPFRLGMFSFYLHSWFHLYIAACTAVLIVAFSRLPYKRQNLFKLLIISGALAMPLASQIAGGSLWVTGQMRELTGISEVESPWHALINGRGETVLYLYSWLFLLLPIVAAGLIMQLWRTCECRADFFAVMTLFGLLLLSSQMRLEYFGSYALILPLCMLANRFGMSRYRHWVVGLLAGLALSALLPAYLGFSSRKTAPGSDMQFAYSIDLFKVLRKVCKENPGVVLADNDDGHIITYYSECSVISNNFIMTPQHERKIAETRELLGMNSESALARRPDIRYILIRRADGILYTQRETCGDQCPENQGLRSELLFDKARIPPRLRVLAESRITVDGNPVPFARLFSVLPK